MKQILLVAQREFLSQAKNRTFIIMTFLSPIIIVGVFGIILWMMSVNTNQKNIAVVDKSNEFITSFASTKNEIYNFYSESDIQGIKDTLLESKTLNALLIIPEIKDNDFSSLNDVELITNGNLGMGFNEKIEGRINGKVEELKMVSAGVSQNQLDQLKSNIKVKTTNLKDGKGKDSTAEYLKFGIALFLAYIIFMFIMLYGVKVMRSVVEEKNNRVVEIIVSSIKPFNLMMGKILGTTFVALTQFAIWIFMGATLIIAGSAFFASKLEIPEEMSNMSTAQAEALMANPEWMMETNNILNEIMNIDFLFITVFFIIFFLLGYLFYSSIFAAIGSAVDNETDTQQFTMYPMFPMMIAMYGSFTTIDNPDGPVSFWLSMIPLTSPISMVTRLPFGVEWWEILLSLGLLIGSTLFMVYIGAKIYRVGILMYGKKPSLKEIWKWIRYSN